MASQIGLRVDPDLMSRIEYAAAKEGLSPASWLRLVAAAAAGDDVQAMPRKPTPKTRGRPAKADFDVTEVLKFSGNLGRLGNNINQISTRIHRARLREQISNETFTEVMPSLQAVKRLLRAVQESLQGKMSP